MSDTPRTDALCTEDGSVPLSSVLPLRDLARELERDLAAAQRMLSAFSNQTYTVSNVWNPYTKRWEKPSPSATY